MASNFRISARRKNGDLELRLAGDFDSTSAWELLNILGKSCDGVSQVFVNTEGLKEVYPFGVDTFENHLYLLKHLPIRLVFTGKHAQTIAPERNRFF